MVRLISTVSQLDFERKLREVLEEAENLKLETEVHYQICTIREISIQYTCLVIGKNKNIKGE